MFTRHPLVAPAGCRRAGLGPAGEVRIEAVLSVRLNSAFGRAAFGMVASTEVAGGRRIARGRLRRGLAPTT